MPRQQLQRRLLTLLSLLMMGALSGAPVIGQTGNNFNLGSSGAGCCGLMSPSGTPAAFATGCYTGNGVDNRKIVTGIDAVDAGFFRVCELTVEAGNNNICIFKTSDMPAGESCAFGNGDLDPSGAFNECFTDRVQTFDTLDTVTIGTAVEVNANGRPYCWEMYTKKSGFHGTFTYTGDGTGNRTLPLTNVGGTPNAVLIKQRNNANTTENTPKIRIDGMPATFSYYTTPVGASGVSTGIRSFSTSAVEVGSAYNTTSKVYYGAWWMEGAEQDIFTYNGNGVSAPGNCGVIGDTQNVVASCTPVRNVWLQTVNVYSDLPGGAPAYCSLFRSLGPCQHFRSSATGYAVVGVGNISNTNDYYAYKGSQPNNSGPGLIGELTISVDNTFKITGGANFVAGCNDNAVPYWGIVTCADGPLISTIDASDWTIDSRLVGLWYMEEASSATRDNYAAFGCANLGADCDLSNNGTVDQNLVNFKQGVASAESSTSGDRLTCALTTCNELKDNAPTAVSYGGWYRTGSAGDTEIIESELGNSQYRLIRRGGTSSTRCTVRDSVSSDINATGGVFASNTFGHAVCTWTNSGTNTVTGYLNGVTFSNATTANEMLAIGTGTFVVNDVLSAANAQTDEIFVWNGNLAATDICRIHACGWDGNLCTCLASDPTIYIDSGRFVAGSCTLPACNKGQPT